jgi:cytidylate kinase
MNPATVITLSVQVGSNGFTIARELAAKLGFQYYDWQITSQAAVNEGVLVREAPASDFVDKIMARLSAATVFEEEVPVALVPPHPEVLRNALTQLAQDELRAQAEHVVRDLARRGQAVIVGHGSQIVLKDWPGVLKVLIHGSFEKRTARFAAEQGSRTSDAVRTVAELDALRGDFFSRVYGVDWLDGSLYDVAIDTDRIPTSAAVEMIEAAAKTFEEPSVNGAHAQAA